MSDSYIPWASNLPQPETPPPPIATAFQQGQAFGYDLGQKQAARSALSGVNLGDPGSVDNALRGLLKAGAVDQAKALTDLSMTRGINSASLPVIQSALSQYSKSQQSQSSEAPPDQTQDQGPDPQAVQAHQQKVLQEGAAAVQDLLATPDPQARQAKAQQYRAQFLAEHVPQQNIDEVLGDLSDAGLKAHGDFLTAAAKGENVPHPTNYAASGTVFSDPGFAQSAQILRSPLMNPIVSGALSKAGIDVNPGIGNAINITNPYRSAAAGAPYQPVEVKGPQGQPVAMSATNFAAGQASPNAQPIIGPTPGQVQAQTSAAQAPYQKVEVPGPLGQTTVESAAQFAAGRGAPAQPGQVTGPINAPPVQGPTPAAGAAYQAGGAQLATDRASSAAAWPQAIALRKVYDLLPTTNTGPGTQATNTWRSFLHSQVPILDKLIPGFQDRTIDTANTDELKKYMVQIAGASAAQYGQGTNEKLAVAASGNPNPDISNLASRDVTRMNIALLRATQARPAAFDATGQDPSLYGAYASNYARTVDPRAFMLDLLSPAERQKLLSTITTTADQRKFIAGKKAAEAAGFFTEADIPR